MTTLSELKKLAEAATPEQLDQLAQEIGEAMRGEVKKGL